MLTTGVYAVLSFFTYLTSAQQGVFKASSGFESYNDGLFTPLENLSALSDSNFTTLGLPAFPKYNVRVKKSRFCDGTVDSYTGYIDVEARHLFFYFFESRNDPDKDDVIFWTNGGPGGSSSMGLFMELGPCRVVDATGPQYHPESWNSNANIFFIDQPVGVGFSYADFGEYVSTTEESAKDIAAFVAIFFEHFTKFKGRGFHMAGESYGGRYIPVYAAEIYDQNSRLVEAGMTPINLTSIMIGNGIFDFYTQITSLYYMACTRSSVPPILDIGTCVGMKQALPRCEKWLKASCIDSFDAINCNAANNFCSNALYTPFIAAERNPYDLTRHCDVDDMFCYPGINQIESYLSLPSTRALLGVSPDLPANYSFYSPEVGAAFVSSLDEFHPTYPHVGALLDRGVRALIYVGKYDWICNYIGNEMWLFGDGFSASWWGGEAWRSQQADFGEWVVDGKKAGDKRSFGGLTYATVEAAGHMVPYDKPKQALALVNRWLHNEDL